MIRENENVRDWEKNLFRAIKDVADIDLQREAWLGKNPNVASSYDEVISILYDDFDFERYIEYYKSIHGEDTLYGLLSELDRLISNYPGRENDELILTDPAWIHITTKAKEILPLLHTSLKQ